MCICTFSINAKQLSPKELRRIYNVFTAVGQTTRKAITHRLDQPVDRPSLGRSKPHFSMENIRSIGLRSGL